MGLTGRQSNLNKVDMVGDDNITMPDGATPDYNTWGMIATIIGLVALGLLAPEILLALAPELAGAAADAGAAEAPAWAIDALANPGDYAPDTVDLARSIVKPKPLPFYDVSPGELPF